MLPRTTSGSAVGANAGYPTLPAAAFQGGLRASAAQPAAAFNGACTGSVPGAAVGAIVGSAATAVSKAPAPVVSPTLTMLSNRRAGSAGIGASPFFGTAVIAGSNSGAPDTPSGPPPGLAGAQHLAELGAALNELEHFDESALVGQAQLGSHMQSQLKTILGDVTADTPFNMSHPAASPASYAMGATPSQKFSAWAMEARSPKARAAVTKSADLPAPGPAYTGPRLEPATTPITVEWAMSLVRHFQHQHHIPLPARYLCRLLDDAEKILDAREEREGAIQNITLRPNDGTPGAQLTIVGDTHGQLADVLWIFFKCGVPSPTNRYLVNGDICDRGSLATEIWAVFLAFMCVWPESVSIQRGNHEDRLLNMDFNCGGFYDEVLLKYGRANGTGALVYEKFARLFARLPLASIVDKQVFVVHGGLSRNPAGGFLRMLRANRHRNAEIPGASAHATPVDLAFVDAMWADPQEAPRIAPNPRGAGLSLFGPDITANFLRENGFSFVVRSHQVPPTNEGYYPQHGGKLVTVFSASNYCGLSGNTGAVLVLRPDGTSEAIQHWAPPFERIAEYLIEPPEEAPQPPAQQRLAAKGRQDSALKEEIYVKQVEGSPKETSNRAERLETEVLRRAARLIVERKSQLFVFWEDCDTNKKGFITKKDWTEGMRVVLGDSLPWKAIGKVLRVKDSYTQDVDYRRFLNRFTVTVVGGLEGGDRWAEELLGRFYGRLLALKGDAGSLEELEGFLGGGDGKVGPDDALEAFRWVLGNTITEEQATALLRTLAAHAGPAPSPTVGRSVSVFEFLSRLDVCFQHQTGVMKGTACGDQGQTGGTWKRPGKPPSTPLPQPAREASPWARSVLTHVGRLLWMEDAEGSPKAGSTRMLEVFRYFDQDGDGLLQRQEFADAVKALLEEYATVLPPELAAETAQDGRIDELVDYVDISGDGVVNYLEFLHAFQPVDRTPGRGLQTDLMEQICTTIWANKPSLLRTMQVIEDSAAGEREISTGRISRENLRHTLRSLNASLEAARASGAHGAPLTEVQIDILVDHAAFEEDDTLDYQAFLDAFQVVDIGAPQEEEAEPLPQQLARSGAHAAPVQAACQLTTVFTQQPQRPAVAAAAPQLDRFGMLSSSPRSPGVASMSRPSM